MLNFRQFEAGPDPFGRTWQVWFKWLQTAISLRHSDSVDVKFVLESEGERVEKTVSMAHPDLLRLAAGTGREIADPWCSRLAALHLRQILATGEDVEKDLVSVAPAQLAEYAAAIEEAEREEIRRRAGGARA